MAQQVTATEIRIPVPWGFIAGKMWGNPEQETILAVHGLQDNANTFDRLVPLLLGGRAMHSLLSIDLPGHGLSSHLPAGRPIYFMDMVSSVYRVVRWLLKGRRNGETSLLYMGHSFGGQIGLYLASVFPECIRKLVVIDAIIPDVHHISKFFGKFKSAQTKMEDLEKKINGSAVPSYTYDEAFDKLKSRFHGELTDGAAAVLLPRSVFKNGNKYSFTMDQRLKFVVYHPFTKEQQFELFTTITSPIQLIVAEETRQAAGGYYAVRMELFNKCSVPCSIYPVEGNHDVHLEHPKRIAPLLQQFLLRHRSSL